MQLQVIDFKNTQPKPQKPKIFWLIISFSTHRWLVSIFYHLWPVKIKEILCVYTTCALWTRTFFTMFPQMDSRLKGIKKIFTWQIKKRCDLNYSFKICFYYKCSFPCTFLDYSFGTLSDIKIPMSHKKLNRRFNKNEHTKYKDISS